LVANILSGLLGALLTLAVFTFLSVTTNDTWIAGLTNLVIAAAAVIAVLLHNSALKHQRNERIWGIKKEILLKLSHTLSEVMDTTSKRYDEAFNSAQGLDTQNDTEEETGDQFSNFSKGIRECLFVYRPLLDRELIEAIEQYEKTDARLEQDVNESALNVHEAYEKMYVAQKELHEKLSEIIKSTAGI
jgi:hypothetical protein